MAKAKRGDGYTWKDERGKWHCTIESSYANPDSKKHAKKKFHKTGKTAEEARKNAKTAKRVWEIAFEGAGDLKIDKKKTFGEYVLDYIDGLIGQITDSTYRSYYENVSRYIIRASENDALTEEARVHIDIQHYQLQNLTKKVFENYYDAMMTYYSRKTLKTPMQMCRRTCKWLVERGLLEENYALLAVPKKELMDKYDIEKAERLKNKKEIFTPEDIRKFHEAYRNHYGEYSVVAVFILETGLRASEFAALTNDCIYLDAEVPYMIIDKTRGLKFVDNNDKSKGTEEYIKVPKNRKNRVVYLSKCAVECIQEMREQTKLFCASNPNDFLYPTFRTGRQRSNSTMENCFKDLCDKLEIDRDVRHDAHGRLQGLCLHSLRHTMVTYANAAIGGNSLLTAMQVGHSKEVDENIYTNPNPEALKGIQTPAKQFIEGYEDNESHSDDIHKIVDTEMVATIKNLKLLLDEGYITDKEYTIKVAQILGI